MEASGLALNTLVACHLLSAQLNLPTRTHMATISSSLARGRRLRRSPNPRRPILLCGVTWLDKVGAEVRFLGRIITRTTGGFDITVRPHLAEEILSAAGTIGHRVCLVPGHRERRIDQTSLNGSDHAYFCSQVGRLLFYVQYRPDMQFVVGQLARRLPAPAIVI